MSFVLKSDLLSSYVYMKKFKEAYKDLLYIKSNIFTKETDINLTELKVNFLPYKFCHVFVKQIYLELFNTCSMFTISMLSLHVSLQQYLIGFYM